MRKVFLYEIEIELKTFNSRVMNLRETQCLKLDFYTNYGNFFRNSHNCNAEAYNQTIIYYKLCCLCTYNENNYILVTDNEFTLNVFSVVLNK